MVAVNAKDLCLFSWQRVYRAQVADRKNSTWPLVRMVFDTENVLKELAPEKKRIPIGQD